VRQADIRLAEQAPGKDRSHGPGRLRTRRVRWFWRSGHRGSSHAGVFSGMGWLLRNNFARRPRESLGM